MYVNSMLDLAKAQQTAANKPSKGNSNNSSDLFSSILGQKSQGRDTNSTAAVQQNKQAAAASNAQKPQDKPTASSSDEPSDINKDSTATDVENTVKEPDTSAEVTDEAPTDGPGNVEEGEAGPVTDGKPEDGTTGEEVPEDAAQSVPIIIVPGPILTPGGAGEAAALDMVAAPPLIQTMEQTAPETNQQLTGIDTEAMDALLNQTADTEQAAEPKLQGQQTVVTETVPTDDAGAAAQAVAEFDPELAEKITAADKGQPKAHETAAEDVTTAVGEEGGADYAEHFAAQVVKEAKQLAGKDTNQQAAAPGEEQIVPAEEQQVIKPVEANEEAVHVAEDQQADPEAQVKNTEEKKTAVPQQHSANTAHVADNGRVEFRLSGAQPLEAQNVAAPPESPEFILNRVVDQVRTAVTPDKTEFFIQLKPDHLGGLSIGLVAEDKGVVAKLMTSSQQVHNALQADMNQMVQMLRDKGINVVQMEVIYDQTANAMSQQQGDRGQQQFSRGHGSSHGRRAEQVDGTVSMYDNISSYEVLAEQGSSVEFSA